MTRHLLTVEDLERDEILELIESGLRLKKRHHRGIFNAPLRNMVVALIFEKPSTRTRVSFEAGIAQLGASSLYLAPVQLQLKRGEPIKDTARVISRYVDAVIIRTFGHETLKEFADYSSVPVINGLSDSHHPCQVLSDLLTISERGIDLNSLVVAYVGDGNNVCHSWILAAGVLGFRLKVATPEDYRPRKDVFERALSRNPKIAWMSDPHEAVREAHVIYTDVWASMGQEDEAEARRRAFEPYQVNAKLLESAPKDALVMHCLPAHRGEEITEDVIEGPRSIVFDQAENRMHLQKALLVYLLKGFMP